MMHPYLMAPLAEARATSLRRQADDYRLARRLDRRRDRTWRPTWPALYPERTVSCLSRDS
jgi:hypothetical protein